MCVVVTILIIHVKQYLRAATAKQSTGMEQAPRDKSALHMWRQFILHACIYIHVQFSLSGSETYSTRLPTRLKSYERMVFYRDADMTTALS